MRGYTTILTIDWNSQLFLEEGENVNRKRLDQATWKKKKEGRGILNSSQAETSQQMLNGNSSP